MTDVKTLKLPQPIYGEMMYSKETNVKKLVEKFLKKGVIVDKNLETTSAGQKAKELDKADGVEDGKISASVWNKYVKEYPGAKTIKNEISVNDAMNSITTYSVQEAHNKAKTQKAALENKTEDGTKQPPEMGL